MAEQQAPHRYSRSPRPSRTTRVTNELGRAIISGHYPQNTILPGDAELLAQFGVSRTVLREAMKILAGKGLLQSKARIGTRVRGRTDWNLFDPDVLIWHAEIGFDAAFIAHVGEMRMALEPEAAALAAERRSADQLAELYDWVESDGGEKRLSGRIRRRRPELPPGCRHRCRQPLPQIDQHADRGGVGRRPVTQFAGR